MLNRLQTVVLNHDIVQAGLRRSDLEAIVKLVGSDTFKVRFVPEACLTPALLGLKGEDTRQLSDLNLLFALSIPAASG